MLKFHVFYYRQDWQKKKNKEAEEELLWHNVISTTVTPIGKLLYYNTPTQFSNSIKQCYDTFFLLCIFTMLTDFVS